MFWNKDVEIKFPYPQCEQDCGLAKFAARKVLADSRTLPPGYIAKELEIKSCTPCQVSSPIGRLGIKLNRVNFGMELEYQRPPYEETLDFRPKFISLSEVLPGKCRRVPNPKS
jgi:hypothetical protein